ncbi:MAG: hypothetical protein MUP03_09115 [Anaerolineales bacterium]|nr:hypothetical protein [Anaerolineales bacterium]
MDRQQANTLPPPPGVIKSLRAGFDTVANHIVAILLPIGLDLLLWLGPRLRLKQLLQPLIAQFNAFPTGNAFSLTDIQRAQDVWKQFADQFNLLSILRTLPIGVSSLMSGSMPIRTPLGEPAVMQVSSFISLIGWLGVIIVAGWIGGSLYYYWISAIILNREQDQVTSSWKAILQTILLSVTWLIILCIVGFPAAIIFSILFVISPFLAQVAVFILALVALWLIVPVFFSPYGIFIRQQDAFRSIVSSIQMTRFTLPTSSLFVLAVFVIGQGFNLLWSVPDAASWMTLIGIAGHAFITTALLAASFIYYRDMNAWLKTVLERLQTRDISSAPV